MQDLQEIGRLSKESSQELIKMNTKEKNIILSPSLC